MENLDIPSTELNNLDILEDHYQKEIDKLKRQIDVVNDPCPLLIDRLNAYVSGSLALGKLRQLNYADDMKYAYPSIVLYNKERDRIISSKLI